jgi:hypothetical protein
MTEQTNRPPNNRRRHHHKRNNRGGAGGNFKRPNTDGQNPRPNGQQAQSQGQNNNDHQENNRTRSGSNRNRRPKSLTPSRVIQKYDNLLEQHLVARKKYFETYGRNNDKNLQKAEESYKRTLEAMNDYVTTLTGWQKEVLDKKLNLYPEDRSFTSNNGIDPVGELVSFEGTFDDPHLLPTQKAQKWSEDTEESIGTIDDYKMYKGIS